ncbi:DUF2891 domain-containing protein [Streptomyces sp. N2-109]|uniref:DUF2891 domain-containing protein n=1 Tax=Streptomyces gossypii TaxID=2883101 RepID=A0ABT2JQN9_9ACTN|nr:DUF2891 domain-containing protein [Streptomyces gossypii]MCT2590204.1 DUF2891 domain-containing protein [Streptomyces gossypii]
MAARADTYTRLALANITREYPYSPAHLLRGPQDLVPPRTCHPAFYGAYDWHSSVHMHWLLLRMLRRYPDRVGRADAAAVASALDTHLTPRALATECAYVRAHPGFERPYGWAWSLALAAESKALGTESWFTALEPLSFTVAELLLSWLPRATWPVRHGTHANSAFALGLILDSAEQAGVPELIEPCQEKLREWFLADRGPSLRWEPSGQDFLSPSLCEADAMRRVLPGPDFAGWLTVFLPELSSEPSAFLTPPRVSDPSDPQIGHLLGLCLSRAAALRGLAHALPDGDPRLAALTSAADTHLAAGLPATVSGDFTTDHWLATFAVLALEQDTPPTSPARAAPPDRVRG